MMADKMWKLVIEVDLNSHRCSKQIKRTIGKLQDVDCKEKVKILRISYDEKNGIVTIAGRFDPETVSKNLKDEAGKVIKSIKIEEEKEKMPITLGVPLSAPTSGKMFNMMVSTADRRNETKWTDDNPAAVGEPCGCRYWFCC